MKSSKVVAIYSKIKGRIRSTVTVKNSGGSIFIVEKDSFNNKIIKLFHIQKAA